MSNNCHETVSFVPFFGHSICAGALSTRLSIFANSRGEDGGRGVSIYVDLHWAGGKRIAFCLLDGGSFPPFSKEDQFFLIREAP